VGDQFELAQWQYDSMLPPEYWAEDKEDDRDHDEDEDEDEEEE